MSQSKFISIDQARPPFFVGVDLGGTSIKVGVVDDLGRPLSWLSIATEAEKGPRTVPVGWGWPYTRCLNRPECDAIRWLALAWVRRARWTFRPACCSIRRIWPAGPIFRFAIDWPFTRRYR